MFLEPDNENPKIQIKSQGTPIIQSNFEAKIIKFKASNDFKHTAKL